jgi:long-chain acyl-CoA synthetase
MSGQRTAVSAMFLSDIFPEYVGSDKRSVCYLPLEHGYARAYDVWAPIAIGSTVYITESRENLEEVLREVQPTHFITIVRTLEKWATQVLEEIEQSSWVKRTAYRISVWIGRRVLPRKWDGKPLPLHLLFLNFLAKQLAFNAILNKFGVSKIKYILTGGTMVPTRLVSLWHMWGLEVREGYAGAEMSAISLQTGRWPKPGNAGKILPWVEAKLTSEGELTTRGPGEFIGYWGDEEATKTAKGDGWIHTGDVVQMQEDGNIKIVDRIKEIIITSGGENLSPAFIEDALKTSPYIKEAAVFGDAHKYPVALVEINPEKVTEWAQAHAISDTSFASLIQNAEINKLLEEEVKKGNAQLSRVQQVKQFRIAPQELNPGATGSWVKLQRKRLYEQYHDLIESMYVDEKSRIGAELGQVAQEVKELKEIA